MDNFNKIKVKTLELTFNKLIIDKGSTNQLEQELKEPSLDLNYYPELKSLVLDNTEIITIIIPIKNKIEFLKFNSNDRLENFNFENLNSQKIKDIWICSNPKLNLNLNQFSRFAGLINLYLYDFNCKGSLLSLRNLHKLEKIAFYNTNIVPSFEYLDNKVFILLPNQSGTEKEEYSINKYLKFLRIHSSYSICESLDFKSSHPLLNENARKINLIINKEEKLFIKLENDLKWMLWLYRNHKYLYEKYKIKRELRKFSQSDERFLFIIEDLLQPWLKDHKEVEEKLVNNNELKKLFNFSSNYYNKLLDEYRWVEIEDEEEVYEDNFLRYSIYSYFFIVIIFLIILKYKLRFKKKFKDKI